MTRTFAREMTPAEQRGALARPTDILAGCPFQHPAAMLDIQLLRKDLPAATIISLGQRPAAAGVHDTELSIERNGPSARLIPAGQPTLADAK